MEINNLKSLITKIIIDYEFDKPDEYYLNKMNLYLSKLKSEEASLIIDYFGLNGPKKTLYDLSNILNITREKVRQNIVSILVKLARLIEEDSNTSPKNTGLFDMEFKKTSDPFIIKDMEEMLLEKCNFDVSNYEPYKMYWNGITCFLIKEVLNNSLYKVIKDSNLVYPLAKSIDEAGLIGIDLADFISVFFKEGTYDFVISNLYDKDIVDKLSSKKVPDKIYTVISVNNNSKLIDIDNYMQQVLSYMMKKTGSISNVLYATVVDNSLYVNDTAIFLIYNK